MNDQLIPDDEFPLTVLKKLFPENIITKEMRHNTLYPRRYFFWFCLGYSGILAAVIASLL